MSKPWIDGPKEVLQHGIGHLNSGSDEDMRFALISIDNAIELIAKVYLEHHKRLVSKDISRKNFEEASRHFPSLIILLEHNCSSFDEGMTDHIIYFHTLRNTLYHNGIGIVVKKKYVEDYASIAIYLFEDLFGEIFEEKKKEKVNLGEDIREISEGAIKIPNEMEIMGKFILEYGQFEKNIRELARLRGFEQREYIPHVKAFKLIEDELDRNTVNKIQFIRKVRNESIHGTKRDIKAIKFAFEELKKINERIKSILK